MALKKGKYTSKGVQNLEYEVERLINHRLKSGRLQYLIKWKGYPETENSWEDEDCLNCPELVAEYHKRDAKKQHLLDVLNMETHVKRIAKVLIRNGRILYGLEYDDGKYDEIHSSYIRRYCPQLAIAYFESEVEKATIASRKHESRK